jgi:hypothetical protein
VSTSYGNLKRQASAKAERLRIAEEKVLLVSWRKNTVFPSVMG